MNPPLYRIPDAGRMSRRSFLLVTSSLAAAAVWSSRALGAVTRNPSFPDYPFQLGVASGDPLPDGVVLWTRLAPKPLETRGGMRDDSVEVSWQIAEDEAMTRVARQGKTVAVADWAHSVHVEVQGLRPDRWYWYQFKVGNEVSPKGRTRTLPAYQSMPERWNFAFVSCQNYEDGFYTAYEHLAQEELDLVIHLGDYIYEGGVGAKKTRQHNSREIHSLDDYRKRYALYKSDDALKTAHALAAWIVTPDDHEVDNDYAGAHPEEKHVMPQELLLRRAAAYRAYYEHMPLRRFSLPRGPDMQFFHRVTLGRLADFFVLDTRQYRTPQPCGNGNKAPCDESLSPKATILGARQRGWLFEGLRKSAATWNVLAQQVMMARVDRLAGDPIGYSMDQWPGYEAERRQVLRFLRDQNIANPIVLAGDIHTNWANELIADFDKPDSPVIATEFVGTSITSGGDGAAAPKNLAATLAENPFVKFHNAERGYVHCQITPKEWRADYRTVEYVTRKGAPRQTRASYMVEAGQPRLRAV